MRGIISVVLFAAFTLSSSALAFAKQTAYMPNGWVVECPNTCVITQGPNGTWSVSDSDGGQITITIPASPPPHNQL